MEMIDVNGNIMYNFKSDQIYANTYCFIDDTDALLIDAVQSDELVDFLLKRKVKRIEILLTHGHYDHIMEIPNLKRIFDTKVICSCYGKDILKNPRKNLSAMANHINFMREKSEDQTEKVDTISCIEVKCDQVLNNGEIYKWKNLEFEVYYTPGHSKDSVCYMFEKKYLFSGDTLMKQVEPILRFPGGSEQEYICITKPMLRSFSKSVIVFPGHGESFKIMEGVFL